jgi:hypothetical protein
MTILDTVTKQLRKWFPLRTNANIDKQTQEIAALYAEAAIELGPEPVKKPRKPRTPKVKEIKFTLK